RRPSQLLVAATELNELLVGTVGDDEAAVRQLPHPRRIAGLSRAYPAAGRDREQQARVVVHERELGTLEDRDGDQAAGLPWAQEEEAGAPDVGGPISPARSARGRQLGGSTDSAPSSGSRSGAGGGSTDSAPSSGSSSGGVGGMSDMARS